MEPKKQGRNQKKNKVETKNCIPKKDSFQKKKDCIHKNVETKKVENHNIYDNRKL